MSSFETVLLIIAIVASLLVTLQLLTRLDNNKYATGLLATFMFLQALMNTMFLLVQSGIILDYWYFYRIFSPLGFLIPSLAYLYLLALLKNQTKPRVGDLVHTIPAIGMFLNYIPYFRLSADQKQQVLEAVVNNYSVYVQGQEGFLPESWVTIIRLVMPIIYIPLYYHVLRSTRTQFDPSNPFDKKLRHWAWVFTNAVVTYFGGVMLFLAVYLVPEPIATSPQFNNVMAIIFMFTFMFSAGSFLLFSLYQILSPNVGVGYILAPNPLHQGNGHSAMASSGTSVSGGKIESAVPVSGTRPSDDNELEITKDEIEQVRYVLDTGQVWKSSDVIISDIAREANLSVRKTSFIINRYLGGNVNRVINRYRIIHAKTMITSGYLDDHSMSGLYKECGYKNKVTFFNAFKRETGMTPSEFRAQKVGSH
ncbi:MAG: helix-turn-helix domain-containing protein [Balneolaceae bacterium]|nr:helix-turn-helix domain-containing protein [Balneolaceae bacterium]